MFLVFLLRKVVLNTNQKNISALFNIYLSYFIIPNLSKYIQFYIIPLCCPLYKNNS